MSRSSLSQVADSLGLEEATGSLQPDLARHDIVDIAAMDLCQADNERHLRIDGATDNALRGADVCLRARMGSSPRCGMATWAPVPENLSSKLSTAAICGPTRVAIVPNGSPGQLWTA